MMLSKTSLFASQKARKSSLFSMKKVKRRIFFFFLISILALFLFNGSVFAADSCSAVPECVSQSLTCSQCVDYLSGKINEKRSQEKSLSSEISTMDNQIKLTEARIENTKQEIEVLLKDIDITKEKVNGLEKDIGSTTKALLGRIAAVYEVGRADPFQIFLTSSDINSFMTRLKYLKIVQIFDKKNVYAAEQSKVNYSNQQDILVEKQKEAEALNEQLQNYTAELDSDKQSKEKLLSETRGSETTYQRLLLQAKAEFQAIQGIIGGQGTEEEIGPVSEGQNIASIIPSASCNSSGPHLHFIVKDGSSQNPFSYLKSVDNSNESGGDPFNPSGDWNWPISSPIQFNQGYGSDTWYIRTYHRYPFHDGIDISSSSYAVNAVKAGVLYRGSYSGSGGCILPYVRVKHGDGKETLYLHVYSAF